MMIDANQVWGSREAIEQVRHVAETRREWIAEPVSPDVSSVNARLADAVDPSGRDGRATLPQPA